MSVLEDINELKLINPPSWLISNTMYCTIMGSEAYAVSSGNSDMDIYGFCIPPKEEIFPHLKGEIIGFGKQKQRFEQFQQHHINYARKSWDFSIYSIVKYFHLVMENNPNMIDSLFTTQRCLIKSTKISELVRENRKMFLHKGAWHKFKGYAYAQLHKMKNKEKEGYRKELIDKFSYDVKFAYHLVRLLNEVEQILTEGDLDLERNCEQLKSIRRGEWKEQEIINYFTTKEKDLEKTYLESKLPYGPDEEKIKQLLMNCLEEHYGNLDKCVVNPNKYKIAIESISDIIKNLTK